MAGRRFLMPEVYKITFKNAFRTSQETIRFRDNNQPVNAVYGNNNLLF
jgi:hypothetical protein